MTTTQVNETSAPQQPVQAAEKKVRKQRSDKGKPRGPRKAKAVAQVG